jgi:hypothetical protein
MTRGENRHLTTAFWSAYLPAGLASIVLARCWPFPAYTGWGWLAVPFWTAVAVVVSLWACAPQRKVIGVEWGVWQGRNNDASHNV